MQHKSNDTFNDLEAQIVSTIKYTFNHEKEKAKQIKLARKNDIIVHLRREYIGRSAHIQRGTSSMQQFFNQIFAIKQ